LALCCTSSQEEALTRPARLLGMYANRSNARWAEGRAWGAPQLYDPGKLQQVLGGAQAHVFRDQVLKLLRSGGIAVQVRGGGRGAYEGRAKDGEAEEGFGEL
jgi:hypothetical protein